MGKCRLNKYLHDIKRHADGLYANCNKEETVTHILLECEDNGIPTVLKTKCAQINTEPAINNMLLIKEIIDTTYKLICAAEITI